MPASVVVVTYQTGEILFPCLSSLLDQAGLEQIVVVDNGNRADATEQLRRLAADNPRVELLSGHGNIGFARACNLGYARVRSEFVLFLNPDCIVPLGAVAALMAEAQKLSEPFILTPRLVNPDGSDQRGARRDVLTPWRALVEALRLDRLAPQHPYFKRFNQHDAPLPTATSPVAVTSGACMLMRRTTFDALGGFDPHYFLHVEDIDLCVTLLRQGGSPFFCPSVSIVHYGRSSQAWRTVVEWHKCMSFHHYFRKNFKVEYPRGFVSVVNAMVTMRYLFMLPAFLVIDLNAHIRTEPPWRHRRRAVN